MESNQDVIKAAAKRMCEQLAAKKIKVPHTAMLEALATGFGLDSWRELKAVIDAPRAHKQDAPPPLGFEQTWSVDAVYLDNNQPYGDDFSGRTPLEAAIVCMVERLSDCGEEMGIFEVTREGDDESLCPSNLREIELYGNGVALRTLRDLANKLNRESLSESAQLGLDLVNSLDENDEYEALTDWCTLDNGHALGAPLPVIEGETLLPTDALLALLDAVEAHLGGCVAIEKNLDKWRNEVSVQLYQVRAICEFFDRVVNSSSEGFAHSLVRQ